MSTLLLALLLPIAANAAVYGADDRRTVAPNSAHQAQAAATAVSVLTSIETVQPDGSIDIATDSLSDYMCKDERFATDPSIAYACTGFLVGPDLLATAGHCLSNDGASENETEGYCKVYDWVFDYQTQADGSVRTKGIPQDRVYHCKRIIYAINDSNPPYQDYALVQLDRPVVGRTPLQLAPTPPQVGEPVSMIGYPLGTPVKFTGGSHVLENDPAKEFFITRLDAFEGNSGSPVFNGSGQVAGILVSGNPGEVTMTDTVNKCERYIHCDENGEHCNQDDPFPPKPGFEMKGADIQKIAPLAERVKALVH